MDFKNKLKNLQSAFDDIEIPRKATKQVLLYLESFNEEFLQCKHNDVSL